MTQFRSLLEQALLTEEFTQVFISQDKGGWSINTKVDNA
jgi:hypothetical protein